MANSNSGHPKIARWIAASIVLLNAVNVMALVKPGQGIALGSFILSPFVDLNGTYDSNVRLLSTNTIDDIFVDIMAGLACVNSNKNWEVNGRAWYMWRHYCNTPDLDHAEWSIRTDLGWGKRDSLKLDLNYKYRYTEDIDRNPTTSSGISSESQPLILAEDRALRVARTLHDLSIAGGRDLTDKTAVDLGYSYSSTEYPATNLNDWLEHKLLGEAGYRATDKTWIHLQLQAGLQDSDSLGRQSLFALLRLGAQTRTTEKISYKASLGFERYDYQYSYNTATQQEYNLFSFDITGKWKATRKLHFQLTGRNGVQPTAEYDNNIMTVYLASLSCEYYFNDPLYASLTGSYRHDFYEEQEIVDGILQDIENRQISGYARINYAPPKKFYKIYVEGRYEITRATWTDYDQLRLTLGLMLKY